MGVGRKLENRAGGSGQQGEQVEPTRGSGDRRNESTRSGFSTWCPALAPTLASATSARASSVPGHVCTGTVSALSPKPRKGKLNARSQLPLQSLLSCHPQHSRNELDRTRTVVVRRDRVRDTSRVDVRVADSDGRDLTRRRLAKGVLVESRREEDEQAGLEARRRHLARHAWGPTFAASCYLLRDLAPSKHLLGVRDRPREPLGHAVPVLAETLRVLPHGPLGALETADKDDDAVALDDASDDFGGAAQVGEGLP